MKRSRVVIAAVPVFALAFAAVTLGGADRPVVAAPAKKGVDPEAELRARLLIYRAHRDAGLRLAEDALRRIGSFRREPSVARAAALAGAPRRPA